MSAYVFCVIPTSIPLVADNAFATEVGNEEITTVNRNEEGAGHQDWTEKILAAEGGDDEATEFHAKDGMDDGNEKWEGEEDGNLAEKRAIQHLFAGADFAKHAKLFAIVATFGKFFEGEDGGAGN